MNLGPEWTPEEAGTSSPLKEDIRMARYFEEHCGLLIAQVNVSGSIQGLGNRYIDGIRIVDPPRGESGMYSYGSAERETVWELLKNHSLEVIEVHDWGLDVLGHCLGKTAIIENNFSPPKVEKTVIVVDGPPEEPAVERVYEQFGVDWVVVDV